MTEHRIGSFPQSHHLKLSPPVHDQLCFVVLPRGCKGRGWLAGSCRPGTRALAGPCPGMGHDSVHPERQSRRRVLLLAGTPSAIAAQAAPPPPSSACPAAQPGPASSQVTKIQDLFPNLGRRIAWRGRFLLEDCMHLLINRQDSRERVIAQLRDRDGHPGTQSSGKQTAK